MSAIPESVPEEPLESIPETMGENASADTPEETGPETCPENPSAEAVPEQLPVQETPSAGFSEPGAKKDPLKKPKLTRKQLIVLIAGVAVIAGIVILISVLGGSKGGKKMELNVQEFLFRQSAFHVDDGDQDTLLLCAVDPAQNTRGLKLRAICNETGETVELTDDGEKADTAAGDNAFYGRVTFHPTEEQTLTWRLEVAAGKFTVPAKTAKVVFYRDETLDAEWDLGDDIIARLDEIAAGYQPVNFDEADAKRYYEVEQQMEAYLAGLAESGTIVSWSFNMPYFIIHLPVTRLAYHFDMKVPGLNAGGESGGTFEVIIADEPQKMILMLPYADDGIGGNSSFREGFRTLTGASDNYEGTTWERAEVSIDLMKNLSEYRVIAINTHGGSSDTGSFFGIGISNDAIPARERPYFLRGSGGQALVTVEFFEHYYQDGQLNDCLFYSGACHSADDDILANMLIRKGASAVLVYRHSVYGATYAGPMFRTIARELIRTDASSATMRTQSVEEAVRIAKQEHGDRDPTNTDFFAWLGQLFGGKYVKDADRAELIMYPRTFSGTRFRLVSDALSGTITGSVAQARDRAPVTFARITLQPENGSKISFYNEFDGSYIYSLPSGKCHVTITADGYIPLEYDATILAGHTTYLESFLLVENVEANTESSVHGQVLSALTGYGVSGATMKIRSGWGNTVGTVLSTIQTDSSGRYEAMLAPGYYTAVVTKEDYVDNTFNLYCLAGDSPDQNIVISEESMGSQFRIVLRWGDKPSDLDLHIVGPRNNSGSNQFHVYYSNMNEYQNGSNVCNLDVDDTSYYGPETITLTTNYSQPYYCYIHDYSGRSSSTPQLRYSSATVDLYVGSTLIQSFHVPTGEYAKVWNVFAIVNGQLVIRNTMTNDAELSYARDAAPNEETVAGW